MSGISSKAAGSLLNRYKFNGGNELQNQEFSDGSGLELYDAHYRMYDAQIGRFWAPDKLGDLSWDISPYVFASNNPISRNDPFGLKDTAVNDKHPKILPEVTVSASNHRYKWIHWYNGWSQIDTHLDDNVYLLKTRIDAGQDILKKGDRYSYTDGILDGTLLDELKLREDAKQLERDLYNIYFSLVTLPDGVVSIVGLTKGISKLPALISAIRAGKLLTGEAIIFGRDANQIYHAFRHIEAAGLNRAEVVNAIQSHLGKYASLISEGKPFNQTILVQGQQVTYTAYKLENNIINVGRITVP